MEIARRFADQRPFVAMVDTYTTVPDRQYCSVSVVSLSTGKGVRRFAFEEPVCGLNAAARYLVVSLSTRLVVHDVVTLTEVRSIRVVQPPESCAPAIALNQQFIAYADFKPNPDMQSCGGMCADVDDMPATYANQVFIVAKALSRTVTSSVTGGSGTKAGEVPMGIVTVGIALPPFSRSGQWCRGAGRIAATNKEPERGYSFVSPQMSASSLLALGKDLAPLALTAVGSGSGSKRRASVDLSRISLAFASRTMASARSPSLLIASADGGIVCEYELNPRVQASMSAEDPPQLDVSPTSMWTLQRTKNNPDMPPPLQQGSPLLAWITA
ncbi:hypothetical protein OSTOST_07280 [Ostertagia ostertagi]